ncbi:MAG TPA: glutamine amidotransferase [Geobacteraceae bacterium]|nr:glutamine amidotransferase [Geobacteraceae bacterium]
MKKIVILKLGSTIPSLAEEQGDFEEWILSPLADHGRQMEVVDPRTTTPLPDLDSLAGMIITGSHCMVTDQHDWSERVAGWLPDVVAREIPLLGICYGHQLLAHAMGGNVANNPNGREFGSHRVNLLPEAADDHLLGSFAPAIGANLCHTQSVIRLPENAVRLAWSEQEPHQAYRIGSCAWGVQFHPEFGDEAMRAYIRECAELLSGEGQDPAALERKVVPTPAGGLLLRRFVEIAMEKGNS